MKSITFIAAALLAAVGDALPDHGSTGHRLVGRALQAPKAPPMINQQTIQGCFKSSGELVMNGTLTFNSKGGCITNICFKKGYAVGALGGGNQCWCGDKYPPKRDLVADEKCSYPCPGYDQEACGGIGFWSVYNTGVALAVENAERSSLSTSTSATSGPTSTSTQPAQTVLVTQSSTPDEEKKGGKNVAGIVAGVVVGFIVVAAALSGGYLFFRNKRNKEIEEEHRRNAAVSAFIGKPPSSSGGMSMTDSRMDPVMAHRRMSDGSIADNQDYSRRILRVTNA
ncbi:putative wsc domain protein [Podospora fimiseda]|uniref:Wsc domain protein n=1 Tax=Podospora fimiseda TaxID=252190 RepID=A0AAN6YQ07_9PEZI|nr:putative wsc domain protein [Podospora fimiseda]